MRLPPHPNNTNNSLVIGAESTISFWIRPSNEEGTLFSKQENSSPFISRFSVVLSY